MLKSISLLFKKINRGFSLIEILLVIAIISVISVLTINTLQQQEQQIKAKKIAAKIQKILFAANAYYANNDQWPDPGDVKSDQEFRTKYFTRDIFDPKCSTQGGQEVCYKYSTVKNETTNQQLRFQLIAEVTTSNKAQQIANMLPYANVTDAKVVAEISLPTRYAETFQSLIQAGTVKIDSTRSTSQYRFSNNGEATVYFNDLYCPVGQNPTLMVLPLWFREGDFALYDKVFDGSSFINIPSLRIKTIGINKNDCGINACNFTYAFQGVFLREMQTDATGSISYDTVVMDFPRSLSGYTDFGIIHNDFHLIWGGYGIWDQGGAGLNYLIFCE